MHRTSLLPVIAVCAVLLSSVPAAHAVLPRELPTAVRRQLPADARKIAVKARRAARVARSSVRTAAHASSSSAVAREGTAGRVGPASSSSPSAPSRSPSARSSSEPALVRRSSAAAAPSPRTATDEVRDEVVRLVNAARAEHGLAPLVRSAILEESAQAYAEDMAERGFFAHRDPDGRASLDRIRAAGYLDVDCGCAWTYATGENLAKGQRTAAQVVSDWLASPSHRENILHPAFTEIGVGLADGYWVEHFGGIRRE